MDTRARNAEHLHSVITSLQELFGERATQADAILEQHGSDESHHSNCPPDIVVFPRSTDEVASTVKICSEASIPIVPYGAGTALEGHVNAVQGGVCIDLSLMDEILAINSDDLDCVVQAGVRRKRLNEELRSFGLFFPIDPGPDATIGGMAATRASGTNAVRYGTMSEVVLSLTVVTADGKIIRTRRRAKKSSAGYDLTHLFVGSEGTLGIITEVTVRLFSIPESTIVARTTFDKLEDAVTTAMETMQVGLPLARIELLDDALIAAINSYSSTDFHPANTLFFELHGSESTVREQMEMLRAIAQENNSGNFEFAERQEDKTRLWQARHDAYYAAVRRRTGAVGWATDVCVPISRIVECISETKKDLENLSVPGCILGHLGDGNFHVVFSVDPKSQTEADEIEAFSSRLSHRAIRMDGTCTGEHGVGLGKKKYLEAEHGNALDIMRTLKTSLDPKNILNPGKVIDP
nr:FAD-linked oxidase C-terminal domain-containing protein [Ruegeria atlantica]